MTDVPLVGAVPAQPGGEPQQPPAKPATFQCKTCGVAYRLDNGVSKLAPPGPKGVDGLFHIDHEQLRTCVAHVGEVLRMHGGQVNAKLNLAFGVLKKVDDRCYALERFAEKAIERIDALEARVTGREVAAMAAKIPGAASAAKDGA